MSTFELQAIGVVIGLVLAYPIFMNLARSIYIARLEAEIVKIQTRLNTLRRWENTHEERWKAARLEQQLESLWDKWKNYHD